MKKLMLLLTLFASSNILPMEENNGITGILIPAIRTLNVKRVEEFLSTNKISQSDIFNCLNELEKSENHYNSYSKVTSLQKLILGVTFFVPSLRNVMLANRLNEDNKKIGKINSLWTFYSRIMNGQLQKQENQPIVKNTTTNLNLITASGVVLTASSLAIFDGARKLIKGDDTNHTKALAIKQLLLNLNLEIKPGKTENNSTTVTATDNLSNSSYYSLISKVWPF